MRRYVGEIFLVLIVFRISSLPVGETLISDEYRAHYERDGHWELNDDDGNVFFHWNKTNPGRERRLWSNEFDLIELNQEIAQLLKQKGDLIHVRDEMHADADKSGKTVLDNLNEQQLAKLNRDLIEKYTQFSALKLTLADLYKIHLMPRPQDILMVADRLARRITTDQLLEPLIAEMKVTDAAIDSDPEIFKTTDINFIMDEADNVLPIIVIYPAQGKAQEVLLMIAQVFDDIAVGMRVGDLPMAVQFGLFTKDVSISVDSPVVPRFNVVAKNRDGTKHSSFIYYAQGNADAKLWTAPIILPRLSPLFEYVQSARVAGVLMSADRKEIYTTLANALYDGHENFALYQPEFLGGLTNFHLFLD